MINLTLKQALYLKSLLIDIYNRYNEFFFVFSLLDTEFSPESHLHNSFPDRVSFHSRPQDIMVQIQKLNDLVITLFSESSSCIVMLDVSIKNHITTSISHIHFIDQLLKHAIKLLIY